MSPSIYANMYMYACRHVYMSVYTYIHILHTCTHRCVYIGHVVPLTLALASYDFNSIDNGTTTFLRSKQSNEVQHNILTI